MGGVVLTVTQTAWCPLIHQIFLFLLVPQHLRQRVGCRRLTVETVKTPSPWKKAHLKGREGLKPLLIRLIIMTFFSSVNQESGLMLTALQCIPSTYFFHVHAKHKLFILWHTFISCASLLLHFADTAFLQIEGLWQACIGQVYWRHFFLTAFAHFMRVSASHILVIFTIFQAFSLLSHLSW